jgi:hypothetical protein
MGKLAKFILPILFTSIFSLPALKSNAQTISGAYWDNGSIPALYYFRPNGTGVRTTYPQGGYLQYGTPYPFAYSFRGNVLILQFASGYTDAFTINGYDRNSDTISRSGIGRSA